MSNPRIHLRLKQVVMAAHAYDPSKTLVALLRDMLAKSDKANAASLEKLTGAERAFMNGALELAKIIAEIKSC